ncbi:MAG: hypothetical protein R2828_23470 [Saprospiraceae bacterium]
MKTLKELNFQYEASDLQFTYQEVLTKKLDQHTGDFNQHVINEIVLWKVNRYAELSESTLTLINKMGDHFDEEYTRKVVSALLGEKGVQLPVASTILRFKNPKLYQIIDQRVYRILYGQELKLGTYATEKILKKQVDLYLQYLLDLREAAERVGIKFEEADRVFYTLDKRVNSDHTLKNYGLNKVVDNKNKSDKS